jgi:hypothetical protein
MIASPRILEEWPRRGLERPACRRVAPDHRRTHAGRGAVERDSGEGLVGAEKARSAIGVSLTTPRTQGTSQPGLRCGEDREPYLAERGDKLQVSTPRLAGPSAAPQDPSDCGSPSSKFASSSEGSLVVPVLTRLRGLPRRRGAAPKRHPGPSRGPGVAQGQAGNGFPTWDPAPGGWGRGSLSPDIKLCRGNPDTELFRNASKVMIGR